MHRSRLFIAPTLASCLSLVVGCGSVPVVGTRDNLLPQGHIAPDVIRWPALYEPKKATFFVSNQIEIAAPPQRVWDILIDMERWQDWYAGASNVRLTSSSDGKLTTNAQFSWTIMDLDFVSTVKEFEPPFRLSWESRKSTIQGYHAWLLIPTETGTRVVTDESQFGILAWLQGIFVPTKLSKLHDTTLERIKERAEAGYTSQ